MEKHLHSIIFHWFVTCKHLQWRYFCHCSFERDSPKTEGLSGCSCKRRTLILESCFSPVQFYSFNFWSGKKQQILAHNFQFILVSSLQNFFSVGFFFSGFLQLSLDLCSFSTAESSSSCMFQHVTPSTISHIERLNSWADLVKWTVSRWEREREIISDKNLSLAAMFREAWSSWPQNVGVRAGQGRGQQLL